MGGGPFERKGNFPGGNGLGPKNHRCVGIHVTTRAGEFWRAVAAQTGLSVPEPARRSVCFRCRSEVTALASGRGLVSGGRQHLRFFQSRVGSRRCRTEERREG